MFEVAHSRFFLAELRVNRVAALCLHHQQRQWLGYVPLGLHKVLLPEQAECYLHKLHTMDTLLAGPVLCTRRLHNY
jgi:hypothetical protein